MNADVDTVRARIDLDEIDYPALARELGHEVLPALSEIADDPNVGLASKAVYLASTIGGPEAAPILERAAARAEPAVRVAAAAAMRNMQHEQAETGLDSLLSDADPGVRKVALRSAAVIDSPSLRARLEEMVEHDADPAVRAAARDALPGEG